jgi:hypothetical protein
LYPLVPAAHQRLSKSEERPECQQLLDEALAAQRQENKKFVETFLQSGTKAPGDEAGWRFLLPVAQMEWLLQVLNDVRVGSWLIMGSPNDATEELAAFDEKTAPYFWAWKIADHYLGGLLLAAEAGPAGTDAAT